MRRAINHFYAPRLPEPAGIKVQSSLILRLVLRKFNRERIRRERRLITVRSHWMIFRRCPGRTVVYFTYMSLLCDTRAILNNYTASAAGGIERYSAAPVRGKGRIIFYLVHTRARECARTRSADCAETRTFKAIYQDHGRVVRCRTIAISHRTILRRTLHTYVRRVMAKKNGDTVRLRSLPNIHHAAADSKVTKAISYSSCLVYGWPELESQCFFFYVGYISVVRFSLVAPSEIINNYEAHGSLMYRKLHWKLFNYKTC